MSRHTDLPVRDQAVEETAVTVAYRHLNGYGAVAVGQVKPLAEISLVIVAEQQMTDDRVTVWRGMSRGCPGYVVSRIASEMLVAVIGQGELNPASRLAAPLRPGILRDFLLDKILFGYSCTAEQSPRVNSRDAARTRLTGRECLQDPGRCTPHAPAP